MFRWLRHRNHDRCSIYAPCRRADLDASWQDFKRRVDDPETRDATIRAEFQRMAAGLPVQPPIGRHATFGS